MAVRYDRDWLIARFDREETLKYIFFWGHTAGHQQETGPHCLSQWYDSPFIVEGVHYKTAEHWMMAQKAMLFDDRETFQKIVDSDTPGQAKALGRMIEAYEEAAWDAHKVNIVRDGNVHKFQQNPVLLHYLQQTSGRILVEASPADPIWGIGMTAQSHGCDNPHLWKGQNLLGFAIMEARDELLS